MPKIKALDVMGVVVSTNETAGCLVLKASEEHTVWVDTISTPDFPPFDTLTGQRLWVSCVLDEDGDWMVQQFKVLVGAVNPICDICSTPGCVTADPLDDAGMRAQLGLIDLSINDDAIVHRSCWYRDPEAHVWLPLDEVGILFINRSDSKCGYCGHGADPRERAHLRRLGFGIEPGAKGCRREFTHLSSSYVGPDAALAAQRIAPTLMWVEPDVAHRVAALLKESANA